MKTFRVKLRVRNNLLVQRREELGLSQGQLSELSGVGVTLISRYECLRHSPLSLKRDDSIWRPSAIKLAEFFGDSPEVLFPDELLRVEHPVAERILDAEDLGLLLSKQQSPALIDSAPNPLEILAGKEMKESLSAVLSTIEEREEMVVRHLFGLGGPDSTGSTDYAEDPISRDEVGNLLGISGGRVGQIYDKAIRKLRHPSRAKHVGPHRDRWSIDWELGPYREEVRWKETEKERKRQAELRPVNARGIYLSTRSPLKWTPFKISRPENESALETAAWFLGRGYLQTLKLKGDEQMIAFAPGPNGLWDLTEHEEPNELASIYYWENTPTPRSQVYAKFIFGPALILSYPFNPRRLPSEDTFKRLEVLVSSAEDQPKLCWEHIREVWRTEDSVWRAKAAMEESGVELNQANLQKYPGRLSSAQLRTLLSKVKSLGASGNKLLAARTRFRKT